MFESCILKAAVVTNVVFFICPVDIQGAKCVSGSFLAKIETGAGLRCGL